MPSHEILEKKFDPAFCARSTCISKILHQISFLLVNLGFTMRIKLYSIKKLR